MKTKEITLTAMLTSMIAVVTIFLKINSPIGYFHLGDAVMFTFALIFPLKISLPAGVIGMGMADLLSGYYAYIVPTIIIKAVMVLLIHYFKCSSSRINYVTCVIVGTLGTILYFITGLILYQNISQQITYLPLDILQAIVIAPILGVILSNILSELSVISDK